MVMAPDVVSHKADVMHSNAEENTNVPVLDTDIEDPPAGVKVFVPETDTTSICTRVNGCSSVREIL
jgi:hypothetical protein